MGRSHIGARRSWDGAPPQTARVLMEGRALSVPFVEDDTEVVPPGEQFPMSSLCPLLSFLRPPSSVPFRPLITNNQ